MNAFANAVSLLQLRDSFPVTRDGSFIMSKSQRAMASANTDALQQAEKLLAAMTRAEKAQILQWVVQDLGDAFPGVESTPDVCGGDARIVRTRIPIWVLIQARHLGTSEADLLRSFPTLRAQDLANAWAYYRSHPDEIEQQIRENEAA